MMKKLLGQLLRECRQQKDASLCRCLHAQLMEHSLECDGLLGSLLLSSLLECGNFHEAHFVFFKLTHRNEHSWTALIFAYAQAGHCGYALHLYLIMQQEDLVPPSRFTFVALLKACTGLKDVERGRRFHDATIHRGMETDLHIGTTIVDLYSKCGLLVDARKVLYKLPNRTAPSWNALISGYAEHGLEEKTLSCFEHMKQDGISPSYITFACLLKACYNIGAIDAGQLVYAEVINYGLERDLVVSGTIVHMYAKCGLLAEAQEEFDKLPLQDEVSWSALIAEYANHGFGEEALHCFNDMEAQGISPVTVTFVSSLKACGITGALHTCQELHGEITSRGWESELYIGNALLDSYAKCGLHVEARRVFEGMPVHNVVTWSAMISAYGEIHESNKAIQCFESMREEGVKPDAVTFTSLLGACSRANLVFEGQGYFAAMQKYHNVEPKVEHYVCMVDLLARSGHVCEAEKFAMAMQNLPSGDAFRALLSACKIHGEVEVALRCFGQLLHVQGEDSAAYLLMADICKNAGRWSDAKKIEMMRISIGACNQLAHSSIEVKKKVHDFVVCEVHKDKDIPAILESLSLCVRDDGYMPNIDLTSRERYKLEKQNFTIL